MASIEERVKGIVVELLGVDEDKVVSSASFREELEADSLDLVELIMAFEDEFGGEISDEDAQKIETVGQAVEYIKSNMGQSLKDLHDNVTRQLNGCLVLFLIIAVTCQSGI